MKRHYGFFRSRCSTIRVQVNQVTRGLVLVIHLQYNDRMVKLIEDLLGECQLEGTSDEKFSC